MINLIVGQNTIGKTLYLKELLGKYNSNNILTNLVYDPSIDSLEYNEDRIDIMEDVTDSVEILRYKQLAFIEPTIDLSSDFLRLATLICKNRDILILDEPECSLSFSEKMIFINYLTRAIDTYQDIFIVTHCKLMLSLPTRKVFTVSMNKETAELNLIEILEEKAHEVID